MTMSSPKVTAPVLAALAAGWLAGCGQPGGRGLSALPMHSLIGAAPAPSRSQRAPERAEAQPRGKPAPRPATGAPPHRWRYIVVHHSASDWGNAAQFDAEHRARGWDELGYHFVITNGHGGPDGHVEVGPRWVAQKHGAHCGGTPGNAYNEHGIGICLVGNFERHMPTSAQMASLWKLVWRLMVEYDISPENVIGHCDAPNAATACPGALFHQYLVGQFRRDVGRALASR